MSDAAAHAVVNDVEYVGDATLPRNILRAVVWLMHIVPSSGIYIAPASSKVLNISLFTSFTIFLILLFILLGVGLICVVYNSVNVSNCWTTERVYDDDYSDNDKWKAE